ncbi:MAG: BBP7 family outer membrane beta-barrel protein [Planctomycetota bacterium]
MTLNRTTTCLAAGVLAMLLAAPAFAQDMQGFQWFAPADVSPYGEGPAPPEGYFFSYEGLYWNVQAPDVVTIGSPNPRTADYLVNLIFGPPNFIGQEWYSIQSYQQYSNQTTAPLSDEFYPGQRIEFGRTEQDGGWLVSVWNLRDWKMGFFGEGPVDITFEDPFGYLFGVIGQGQVVTNVDPQTQRATAFATVNVSGFLPVTFGSMQVENKIDTWGVEADAVRRTHRLHHGGYLEFMLGARYLEFNERFSVQAETSLLALISPQALGQSEWFCNAENHVIGPNIGIRYFHQHVRFRFNAEGRFTAGYNSQNLRTAGRFTTIDTFPWLGGAFDNKTYMDQFTPVVEGRFELHYQLTRAIFLKVGYTALWMGNVARAPEVLEYSVPVMGINTDAANDGDVLMSGLTMGISINR